MASDQDSISSVGDSQGEDQKLRKLKQLNMKYTLKEEMFGLLTSKKAFYRWIIFTKKNFSQRIFQGLLKSSRITPSKAIWILFTNLKEKEINSVVTASQKNLHLGFSMLQSLFQKILYKNKHHYFFQGRLLFLRLPLLYILLKRTNQSILSAFKKLRENMTRDKLEILLAALKLLEKPKRNPLIDAIWRMKFEGLNKKKGKVQFRIDNLEEPPYKSDKVT